MESTLEQMVKEFLTNSGMFDEQVKDVFDRVVKDESMKELSGRWNDKLSDYGPGSVAMSNIIISGVKAIALEYIDEVCPQAWFRPLFMNSADTRKLVLDCKVSINTKEVNTMAKCKSCDKEMNKNVSCTEDLTKIPYGSETRENFVESEYCHDCGTPVGGYHHSDCDVEECPVCHGQLIGCNHQ